jgi:hypothetical protein
MDVEKTPIRVNILSLREYCSVHCPFIKWEEARCGCFGGKSLTKHYTATDTHSFLRHYDCVEHTLSHPGE